MKICFRCKEAKPLSEYTVDNKSKDGLRSTCKACNAILGKVWVTANKDKLREKGRGERWKSYLRSYRKEHKADRAAEARRYRAKYRDEVRAHRRKHYAENKEQLSAYRAEYIKNHPWFNREASSRHRATVLQRTPKWVDYEALKEIFRNCPKDMVVDHIIPLRGKNVSGLHVPSNLQYLTPEENGKKSNKFVIEGACETT